MRNPNEIQTVDILDTGEQIAFVMTSLGSYVVTPIPNAFMDLREVTILQKVDSTDEAIAWLQKRNVPGRPPLYGDSMRQVSLYLRQNQIAWLQAQPDGMAATIRGLVDEAIEEESKISGD